MRGFSSRFEVKKRHILLWTLTVAVIIIAAVSTWLVTTGKRALLSRIAAAIRETPLGSLEFREIETTRHGIELIGPQLKHPETGKLMAEAGRVAVGLTVWDLLKSRGSIKSVTVTVDGLRIYPRYVGDGRWDLEEMLREAPERETGDLREMHIILNDARIEAELDTDSRANLSAYIESFIGPHRERARNSLNDWLTKTSVNLEPSFGDDVRRMLADGGLDVPGKLELAVDGRLHLGLQGAQIKGDLTISRPFAALLEFGIKQKDGSGEIRIGSTSEGIMLNRTGWLSPVKPFWSLREAALKSFELKLILEPESPIRVAVLGGELTGVSLFPERPHELQLESGKFLLDKAKWRASAELNADGSEVYVTVNSDRELAAEATDFPLSLFIADIKGVSSRSLSGAMRVSVPSEDVSGFNADAEIELTGVRAYGYGFPGDLLLAGELEGGTAHGTVAWVVDGRRLVYGRVSGDTSRLRIDTELQLRRGDIPPTLMPRESIPAWVKEVRIELAALFDIEQRTFAGRTGRAEFTMANGQVKTPAASFEITPGFFFLTLPQLELLPAYPPNAAYKEYAPDRIVLSASIRGNAESGSWHMQTEGRGKAQFANERVYFDVNGGGYPEHLTFDVNAGGVLLDEPLGLIAKLLIKPNALTVSEMDVYYASSRIAAEGNYEPGDENLRFAYEVSDLPLHLWIPTIPMIAPVDMSGVISGTIREPVVRVASFSTSLGVDVGGNRISASDVFLQGTFENSEFRIAKGSTQIGGELLFFDGALDGNRFSLRASCEKCSLFSVVTRFVPDLEFPATGEGELQLKLHGSYTDPEYEMYYRQVAGSLAGERLDRLELEVHGDAERFEIAEAHLSMGEGSLDVQGVWQFGKEEDDEWAVTMERFPVAPLTYAYSGLERLQAGGFVSGEMRRSSDDSLSVSQGYFVLEDGVILGTSVDGAEIAFNVQPAGLYVDKLELSTPEYLITASGFWSREPEETSISVNVPYIDLALFSPLVPENLLPLSGKMGFISEVTRDENGRPVLVGSFLTSDESGLRVGMFSVDSVRGMLEIARGAVRLKATLVQSDESEMVLDGAVPFPGTDNEFDMAVHAENFSLEFLRPFMRESQWDYTGKFTTDLGISGTWSAPGFTGPVEVELADIAFEGNAVLARLAGGIELECESGSGDALLESECVQSIQVDMNLYPDSGNSDGAQGNFAHLAGSATLAPGGRELDSVNLGVNLANLNSLEIAGLFKGGLSGSLTMTKAFAAQPISVTGDVTIRRGATLRLPTLSTLEPADYGVEVMLGDIENPLKITIAPDCWVRYPPLMMEVALNGELMVSGTAGDPRVEGELTAPKGSLVMLNRIVRLTGPATIKVGLEEEYEYGRMPHLFGTAAVELPGALSSARGELPVEILPSDLPLAPTEEDLTVYFGFHDMRLDALSDEQNLDEIHMYSEPPLSRQTIMIYLLGGQGLDVSPTGLQTFLGSEALAFSGSRLSRFLEESLDFKRFEIRALSSDEGTPFLINMEKEFAPQFTVSYMRTFLEEVDERQEVSGRFYFDERFGAKTYVELMWRRRGQQQEEIVGNLGFNFRF